MLSVLTDRGQTEEAGQDRIVTSVCQAGNRFPVNRPEWCNRRTAMSEFKNPAMKQLTDQQVRFTPPARRLDQLARAERLLIEIDHARQYPYQYVCYRVTDFRPNSYPDLRIDGKDLEHDLYLFIEAIARSTPAVPVEQMPEPVLTLEQVSEQFHVSTKTISRWRERGLVGRRILRNGRRQVGYLKSMVDRFLT